MNFKKFRDAVHTQFTKMAQHELFRADITGDELYDHYLRSFPEGTNPIYIERTEHDCSSCRNFIRSAGNAIALVNDEIVTIWDVVVDDEYQIVANALAKLVREMPIQNIFRSELPNLGLKQNHQETTTGVKTWDHFYFDLPARFVNRNGVGSELGKAKTNRQTLERSISELSSGAVEIVLDLIGENNLYRGEEYKPIVEMLQSLQIDYGTVADKDRFLWVTSLALGERSNIRGTAIGSLLVDLTEGKELERAVASFEEKVAPQNYRRTTAPVSKKMVEAAQTKVGELGLSDALQRRFAVEADLTINNVLFADRKARGAMQGGDAFQALIDDLPDQAPKAGAVHEIPIESFMRDILPNGVISIEALLENRHLNNLMSVIAPVNPNAKSMFHWGHNFSWSYRGEVTDSIRERVRKAGGKVDGDLRCSLSWFNTDDLDLHCKEPGGNTIYHGGKTSQWTGGQLDVDMNVGNPVTNAVENIVWADKNRMIEGDYTIFVHNYTKRMNSDVGFEIEIEFGGEVLVFPYSNAVRSKEAVEVATINYSKKNGITVKGKIPSTKSSKEAWGLTTQKYHRVSMAMLSPNHWDDLACGNKHWFFILENCINPEQARGFYNEFLSPDLRPHRKVFEMLSAKLKTPKADDQLSGLGFSSTNRASVTLKVTTTSSTKFYNVKF